MRTSERGIKLIAKREGVVLHVYKDSKGLPTAGVGHLLTVSELPNYPVGKHITQAQSDAWLIADLKEAEDAVNALGVKLEQHEFDALVSLTFNIGVRGFERSTVARKLKAGDKHGAANAILLWNKPPEIQGRRRTEYSQFLNSYSFSAAVPKILQTSASDDNATDSTLETAVQAPINEPPPNVSVEESTKETSVPGGAVATTTEQKVTTETPKGDAPEVPPTQVSKNGNAARWQIGSGIVGTVGSAVLGWATGHLDSVGIISLCVTALILALVFRGTITDMVRMQAAADTDKRNVT